MPTYEYHCKECGYYFDVSATIAEKERGLSPTCEKCGSDLLEQVFGGISLVTGRGVTASSAVTTGGGCCGGNQGRCC